MIDYVKNEEKKTKLREEEFQLRLNKIQAKMDSMANTVVKNERERLLKEELKLVDDQKRREENLYKLDKENKELK